MSPAREARHQELRWLVVYSEGAGRLCGRAYGRYPVRWAARNAVRWAIGSWRGCVVDSRMPNRSRATRPIPRKHGHHERQARPK